MCSPIGSHKVNSFFFLPQNQRKKYLALRKAALKIKAILLARKQNKQYNLLRSATVVLQKYTRRFLCVKRFRKRRAHLLLVQVAQIYIYFCLILPCVDCPANRHRTQETGNSLLRSYSVRRGQAPTADRGRQIQTGNAREAACRRKARRRGATEAAARAGAFEAVARTSGTVVVVVVV